MPKHKVDLVERIHLAWKEFSIETLEVLIAIACLIIC
jgi:hypothetical protein